MSANEMKIDHLRVLVVDDDQSMLGLVITILQAMGIRHFERALDGFRAVELFEFDPGRVDFIVCDWNMPGMSGLDVFKRVYKINPGMPFLMLTGRSSTAAVTEAAAAGLRHYMKKPFSPDALQKRVRAMLNGLVC